MRNLFSAALLSVLIMNGFSSPAQTVHLSAENLSKLNESSTGRERLLNYYKYFRRDSIRLNRELLRKFKHSVDSSVLSLGSSERRLSNLRKRIFGLRIGKRRFSDSLQSELLRLKGAKIDSLLNDSTYRHAKQKLGDDFSVGYSKFPLTQKMDSSFGTPRRVKSEFQSEDVKLPRKFSIGSQTPTVAILPELENRKPPDELNSLSKIKDLRVQLDDHVVRNSPVIVAQQKALVLNKAQQRVSRLFSKYRKFTDSNRPETGIRRSSLAGKSLRERLYINFNYHPIKLRPLALDISPGMGYKFNRNFFVGTALSYRLAFVTQSKGKSDFSFKNHSYCFFANYTFRKAFYGYAEYERSRLGIIEIDKQRYSWTGNYFVGLGKRALIHQNFYLALTALYKVNHIDQNPLHSDRFHVRFGVELSELSTRRKQVLFHPNR